MIDFGVGDPRELDAGVHPRCARGRDRRGVARTRARSGCRSTARRSRPGSSGASASRSTRRPRSCRRSARRRRSSRSRSSRSASAASSRARACLSRLRARRAVRGRRGRVGAAARGDGWLPDLDAFDRLGRARAFWICYPNNPTGATAPLSFYEELAALAREHGFLLCSDEAYSELWFGEPPVSALQVADRENVVVFNTLSKRSSMTGYRSGFVCAPPRVADALRAFRPSLGRRRRSSCSARRSRRGRTRSTWTRARVYRRKRETLLPVLEAPGSGSPAATRRSSSGSRRRAVRGVRAAPARPRDPRRAGLVLRAGRRGLCADGARADPGRMRAGGRRSCEEVL